MADRIPIVDLVADAIGAVAEASRPTPPPSTPFMGEIPPDRTMIDRINRTMEECKGNRHQAAQALGITKDELKKRIWLNKELKSRWPLPDALPKTNTRAYYEGEVKVPKGTTSTDVLAQSNPSKIGTDNGYQIQKRINAENLALKRTLKKCGFSSEDLLNTLAVQQLNGRHFKSVVDITGGNVAINAIRIPMVIRALEEKIMFLLRGTKIPIGADEAQAREIIMKDLAVLQEYDGVMKTLTGSYTDLLEEARKTSELSAHMVVISARLSEIEHRRNFKGDSKNEKLKGVLSFAPKQKPIEEQPPIDVTPAEEPVVTETPQPQS